MRRRRGFLDRPLHRIGHLVGVEHHLGVHVAGRAADGLHQRRFAPQEALLVGVEDGHQRDLGQVEPFAEQVDAHQHVELAQAEVAEQLDPLEGVQVAMQPLAADVLLAEIGRQVLGQPLGERGDQHPLAGGRPAADLLQQVRHLRAGRRHFDLRVQQARGPDHLLDVLSAGLFQFVGAGRGRDVNHLLDPAFPLRRTAAAGCPARWAGGSRARPASPCGCGRRSTCRGPAAPMTCDSSTNSRKSSGKKLNSVSGGEPAGRPESGRL